MGRAPSYRSSTREAAREEIERRWGAEIRVVDAIVCIHAPRLASATVNKKINDRLDRIRELRNALARTAPAMVRAASSAMRDIASLTAEIQRFPEPLLAYQSPLDGSVHSRVAPAAEDITALETDVREMITAIERARARLEPMARLLVAEGTAEDLQDAADALRAYDKKPTEKNRRALRSVANMKPGAENLTVVLVRKAERARPRLAAASEGDWAYYAIAAGIDAPCDSDTFRTKRRDRWREILRRARNCGGAAA